MLKEIREKIKDINEKIISHALFKDLEKLKNFYDQQ